MPSHSRAVPNALRGVVIAAILLAYAGTPAEGQTATATAAQAAASRFWSTILTQCGDSYYEGVLRDGFRRYKMPVFPPVVPARVSEADRENGYQWRGLIYLTGKVHKYYDKEKGWSEWLDSSTDVYTKRPDVFMKVEMWNLNGHWHFKEDGDVLYPGSTVDLDPPTVTRERFLLGTGGPTPITKPTCAVIPGTPEYVKQQAMDNPQRPADPTAPVSAKSATPDGDSYPERLERETERMQRSMGMSEAEIAKSRHERAVKACGGDETKTECIKHFEKFYPL